MIELAEVLCVEDRNVTASCTGVLTGFRSVVIANLGCFMLDMAA
jgi:hypothetical protein